MANEQHRSLLVGGVDTWNRWRDENADIQPDLSEANLFKANLSGANLSHADLSQAYLFEANLFKANLSEANLFKANLRRANLFETNLSQANLAEADLSNTDLSKTNLCQANLTGATLTGATLTGADLKQAVLSETDLSGLKLFKANLSGANLSQTNLSETDFRQANLTGADLTGATLGKTDLQGANLSGCRIYGISPWNVKVNQETSQSDLIITRPDEITVTVSDLELAQFIGLLLNRKKLRTVFSAVTSRIVLLMGRFTSERKIFLDALSDDLHKYGLVPIIIDFGRATSRDFDETIRILVGFSMFAIVDITKPKSAPEQLNAILPDYQTPFVLILQEGEDSYSMFMDLAKHDWVRKPILAYDTRKVLLEHFRNVILEWAWKKHLELQRKKNEDLETISIEDIIAQKEKMVPW